MTTSNDTTHWPEGKIRELQAEIEQLRANQLGTQAGAGSSPPLDLDQIVGNVAADVIRRLEAEIKRLQRVHDTNVLGYEAEILALKQLVEQLRAEISTGETSVCGVIGGLEAEIERLTRWCQGLCEQIKMYDAEIEHQNAVIGILRPKIERLTAPLREIADLRYGNTSAAGIARAALEDK